MAQRVISTAGRLGRLAAKEDVESMVRLFFRFSDGTLPVIFGKSRVTADADKIGPAPIFELSRQDGRAIA